MENYTFTAVGVRETDAVMELIRKRIEWFAVHGIRQWRETEYFTEYPRKYFEECAAAGRLLGMKYAGRLCGCVVLSDSDPVWDDDRQAVYIHNLVADPLCPGVGRTIVEMSEKYARATGKTFVRLDCQADNDRLNRFYRDLGYRPAGTLTNGAYSGNKWEKWIKV